MAVLHARHPARAAGHRGLTGRLRLGGAAVLAALLTALALTPAAASAHGPVAPVATGYLARATRAPAGVQVKIVDGYVRIWMRVQPTETLVVLDYRGAPYLRFSPAGVAVNRNSEMFYLNQTPTPLAVPSRLKPSTPPDWHRVTGGHSYEWHDGRLQALANVALSPGTDYVGPWRIPVVAGGRPQAVSGGLWHQPRPSPVWFWPAAVLLLCTLAARRVRRPRLDATLIRVLAFTSLSAGAVAAVGIGLHGRPGLSGIGLFECALVLAFVAWAARHVQARPRPEWIVCLMIAVLALWEGVKLLPALIDPYVLIGLPANVARIAAVLCLGAGSGLLVALPALVADDLANRARAVHH